MTGGAPARPVLGVPPRLRSVWPLVTSAGAAIALVSLLAVLLRRPEIPLVFVHLVVLVLASGAAYLLDDSAAQVTAVVPRSLLRRRLAAVARGFVVAVAGWGAVCLVLDRAFVNVPLAALTWEVAGLFWLAVAASAVMSHRDQEPGNIVASTLGLLFIGAFISRPLPHFSLLISESGGPVHAEWWALTVVASVVTLVAASSGVTGRLRLPTAGSARQAAPRTWRRTRPRPPRRAPPRRSGRATTRTPTPRG